MTIAEMTRELNLADEIFESADNKPFIWLLEADLASLAKLRAIEKLWLNYLRQGKLSFNFDFDRDITQRYYKWVDRAQIRLRQLELQEEKGCNSDKADEFRTRLEEAQEMMGERLRDERSSRDRLALISENSDRYFST